MPLGYCIFTLEFPLIVFKFLNKKPFIYYYYYYFKDFISWRRHVLIAIFTVGVAIFIVGHILSPSNMCKANYSIMRVTLIYIFFIRGKRSRVLIAPTTKPRNIPSLQNPSISIGYINHSQKI